MSKTTITVEIFQCDHTDDSSNRCTIKGERSSIKECGICAMDLCSRHYQFLTVTRHGGTLLSYYFCNEHANEFINGLVETYGDTRPQASPNMGK
ncbi:MAG: hypothetical protein GTN59_08205 [Candidatus Dadabacteria bacterium]|nr:hypothetical protein [Candidatus Dadabacteria bacterium]